jgi:methyl-accepting chemotaxis protein
MKIRTKLVSVNVVIMVATIAVITGVCLWQFNKTLQHRSEISQESRLKTFRELLRQKGSEFRIVNGTLMAGNYALNGNYELPDRLKELCGGTATIFMGDMRVSTNVLKDDGSRAVGTRLEGPAYDAVFKKGVPYRGTAKILGTPYFTSYDPIKDSQGNVIGALYVGVSQKEFFAEYDRLKLLVVGLAFALLTIAIFVNRLFIHRLFMPINQIHDVLNIARTEGDLTHRLDYLKKDEVGEMCDSFNGFMDKIGRAHV